MSYDVLVIGGGPAGLSAALNVRARGKRVLVISNPLEENPLWRAELVDNCLGLPGLSGAELLRILRRHGEEAGAEFREGRVLSALRSGEEWYVSVGPEMERAGAVVLASGALRGAGKKFPGEEALLGRGVSYCATCDGMLYRNKAVVVAGLAPDAPAEAKYLKSLGCQVVYVSPRQPEGLDQDIPYVKASRLAVKGEQTVTGLEADGALLPCAGIFILRRTVAPTDLLPELETEEGVIRVDRSMATNLPGVFAAGDCTGGPLQVSKAVGEGHVAALSACEYADAQNNKRKEPQL